MAKATLDCSVGKQEGWSEKVREHFDKKGRHELGSPEYVQVNSGEVWHDAEWPHRGREEAEQ